MKILYIAPIYDGTGYAHMANHTIQTLNHAGLDVTVRKVKLTGQHVEPPTLIKELEKKPLPDKIDVTIQHMLPPLMTYNRLGGVNIGYFHCETTDFTNSGWQHQLNLMDKIWVSCQQNKEACETSKVRKPVQVVTTACWPYEGKVGTALRESLKISPKTLVFYTIGDFSARKGIKELIESYLRAFTNVDDVILILKTYVDGKHPQESLQIVQNCITDIKNNLRLSANNNYPRIIVLPEYMDESLVQELHQIGNVFVTFEKGAAWNIPAMEAYNAGNRVVCIANVPPYDFLPSNNTRIIFNNLMPRVYGMGHCTYPGLYTGNEQWYGDVSIKQAVCALLDEYELGRTGKHNNKILLPDTEAQILKEILCNP